MKMIINKNGYRILFEEEVKDIITVYNEINILGKCLNPYKLDISNMGEKFRKNLDHNIELYSLGYGKNGLLGDTAWGDTAENIQKAASIKATYHAGIYEAIQAVIPDDYRKILILYPCP